MEGKGPQVQTLPVMGSDWQRQSKPGPTPLQNSIHISKDRMGTPECPSLLRSRSLGPKTSWSSSSCGVPMLGHVWALTLRACPVSSLPRKRLTPGPKMQYLLTQQATPHSLGVLFPLAHRPSLRETGKASKGLPNATHQSPPPQTVDSAASILRSWQSSQGLAKHRRQQPLLPSPLTKARLVRAKSPDACSPLTCTRKGLRLGSFYGFA